MRKLFRPNLRRRNADGAEHRHRTIPGRTATAIGMCAHYLGDLLTRRIHGIERRHRFLKNHRRLLATNAAQFLVAERQHVAAIEQNVAARFDATRCVDQTQNRECGERLSASAFANQRQRFTARDVE